MDDSLVLRSVLSIVMIGSGLLVVWMASAAASGQLQRNSLAGIRTPSTMSSDVAWVAAHVRAKRPTMIAGYLALATGLVVLIPMPEWGIAVVVLGGCGALLGFVLYGARVGVQAAKAVLEAPGARPGAKPADEPDA
ncbi:SdpI family protein [Pseudoclavibacter sp. VKM Ac-2888]|uniref:SdpI family protein n=1 Tax=Pseudoclavibacter sp. VKM Ac-2888 TaxID=2783830 RepID=UPI00188B2BC1|nr:SdpI family protein [Pseudoclavibacter sp. VKM Ac-2888]MBF4552043.1 SdpI family protein [Pseudoclavibacter sp. VKM Ac-2888]